jgi:hypothetical protein
LDAARTVTGTAKTWSVGFGLRTCRQSGAVVGTVAAAKIGPIAVEVGPVSTAADVRAITTADVWSVAIEAWSWFGGGLTTRSTDARQGSRTVRTDASLVGRTAKSAKGGTAGPGQGSWSGGGAISRTDGARTIS